MSTRTDYNVRDTFSFVNRVKNKQLPENYVLVSLDVVSLFTNIPYNLVLEIIEIYWQEIEINTTLTKSSFLKLLSFVFNNCHFFFEGKFYQQIFGTPMGSPISPILALIVMDYLLDKIKSRLPFELPFICKFVDDLVTSVPRDQIDNTLEIFNSINNNIQFTVETENNGGVPFLDTRIIRTNSNSIITDWYQKSTDAERYINYYSNHPTSQKYNTIIALKNRILYISDACFHKENLNKLFNIFVNNGYPKNILRKLIYNTSKPYTPTKTTEGLNIVYKKLPYIQNLTDNIISYLKEYDIRIAKYNSLTSKNCFSRTKDRVPILQRSNIVYNIPCLQCDKCYMYRADITKS